MGGCDCGNGNAAAEPGSRDWLCEHCGAKLGRVDPRRGIVRISYRRDLQARLPAVGRCPRCGRLNRAA